MAAGREMTAIEDIAAAQTVEGCLGVIDLMGRLEAIAKWDIERAVALYFQWKGRVAILMNNPEMLATPVTQDSMEGALQ